MTDEQRAHLPTLLQQGPEAYDFRGELWTRGRIAAVIRLTCGISYHLTHIGRLCKAIRWSLQNPARHARQRDEAAITRWRDEIWPTIKKGAEEQQQRLFFIDESGLYPPLPSVVRAYAPVGHTPILREWWTRGYLSAISAISLEGKLYFHCQDYTMNAEDVVTFLEHLLRKVPRNASIWSVCRRMPRSSIPARASGNSSKASSGGICAVSTASSL